MDNAIILNIVKKQGSLLHYGHFISDFIVPIISFLNNDNIKINTIYLDINNQWPYLYTFINMAERILNLKIIEINSNDTNLLAFPIYNINTRTLGPYTPNFFKPINYIKNTLNKSESPYKVILIEKDSKLNNIELSRRQLKNYTKIKEVLNEYYGVLFKSVILETLSIDEQISLFMNAEIVIGQHRADLSNIIWMNQPKCLIIEFLPNFVNTFINICKVKNFKYSRIQLNYRKLIEVCSRRMPHIIQVSNPIYNLVNNKGVINILRCGLGNRLFMIANGFALAKFNNIKFYINKHVYTKHITNKHSTNNYNDSIFKHIVEHIDIKDNYMLEAYGYKLINTENDYFKPPPRFINSSVILKGFYQNYDYFKDVQNEISTLFLKGLETHIQLMSEKYNTENTAFLHIRRGDYLKPVNMELYSQPSMDYYIDNIGKLKELNKNIINIFIISNDISFVKSNDYFNNPLFKIIDEPDELNTLALMSLCKAGAIITNSTFGWWGAFLGAHLANNPVFVFKKWMNNKESPGLIPDTWIKV